MRVVNQSINQSIIIRSFAAALMAGVTSAGSPALAAEDDAVAEAARPIAFDVSESPSLALEFIENRGQFETGVRYAVRSRQMLTVFRDDHVRWLVYPGESNAPRVLRASPVPAPSAPPIPLALTFEGADRAASVEGLELRDAYVNFFHGRDPAQWVSRVPTYGRVLLYPTGNLFDGPANQDGFVLRLERD